MAMTLIPIGCPLCPDGRVTIVYYGGDAGIWRTSNGDGIPPEPAQIEDIQATCACWPEEKVAAIFEAHATNEHPVYTLLERLAVAWLEIGGFYAMEAAIEYEKSLEENPSEPVSTADT